MKNNSKGFTIIELLVVISIIGLLSTISVVALNGARKKSRDAKRIADVGQMQTSLDLYFNDWSGYPAHTGIALGGTTYGKLAYGCTTYGNGFVHVGATCTTTYMGLVPANPTPGGASYTYTSAGADYYQIAFTSEEAVGGLAAGAHVATSYGMAN